MKKSLLLLLLLLVPAIGVFADNADYFTFTMGAGGGYDMVASDVTADTIFGVDYYFDKDFSGGFKYFKLSAGEVAAVNITVTPIENLGISLYTGADTLSNVVFGAGVNYDFFTKKDKLFSGLGVYIDWLAGATGSAFDISSGGTLTFGLKTRVGL